MAELAWRANAEHYKYYRNWEHLLVPYSNTEDAETRDMPINLISFLVWSGGRTDLVRALDIYFLMLLYAEFFFLPSLMVLFGLLVYGLLLHCLCNDLIEGRVMYLTMSPRTCTCFDRVPYRETTEQKSEKELLPVQHEKKS